MSIADLIFAVSLFIVGTLNRSRIKILNTSTISFFYYYRCGRTARIGNTGTAVLFLLPSEDAYVDFIALNQKVTSNIVS